MSVDNFKPTIWHDMILEKYEERSIFMPLMNREYEGDISGKGDTVKILSLNDFADYAYSGTVTYSDLDDASMFLKITEDRVVSKKLDDLDALQANPKLAGKMAKSIADAFLRTEEAFIAAKYTEAGIADGSTTSVTAITSANVISTFGDMASAFDEADVPDDGRVAIVPPWLAQKIVLAGVIRDTDNSGIISAGYIGQFQGFQIFKSNRIVHSGTTWYAPMFFRRNDTIAFAMQITDIESMRLETVYGDGFRARHSYGAKVIRPESLGVLYCSEGSETAI